MRTRRAWVWFMKLVGIPEILSFWIFEGHIQYSHGAKDTTTVFWCCLGSWCCSTFMAIYCYRIQSLSARVFFTWTDRAPTENTRYSTENMSVVDPVRGPLDKRRVHVAFLECRSSLVAWFQGWQQQRIIWGPYRDVLHSIVAPYG